MAQNIPNSYRDPYWSNLAGATEQKLGLPSGLLVSVLTRGERSNANQVSEASARTPFQIIPDTRDAAIKRWGIDAYVSPENAAEVAGLLLQDSLKRNQGDVAAAAGEYHAGPDRSRWGPRTRSYIERVTSGLQAPSAPPGASAAPDQALIARAYDAYRAGRMDPDAAAEFEQDVNSGLVQLPLGASLKRQVPAPAAFKLPMSAVEAYNSGRMDPEARTQLEADVRAEPGLLPEGVTLSAPRQERGFLAGVRESITGEERRTPETEALPDWASMPELNSFSLASAKTGLGTLFANPDEAVQVIQANFPGVQVRQDERGNYLLRSSMDGQEYAIKPGFRASDIPRAAAGLLAFTPAGRAATIPGAAAATAGTQAVIEATQAATGGTFSPAEVGVAGALGAAVPAAGRVLSAARQPAQAAFNRLRGVTPEAPAAAAPSAAPAATAAAAAPMPSAELGQTARSAAEGGLGSRRATQVLAEQAAPDPKTVEAAQRLGIDEFLQPDHVTTNQAYRELAQAVKSVPGSQARAAELQGLEQVAKRGDDLISEIGGTTDVSQLSANIKGRMQATQQALESEADKLYADLRAGIPARSDAPAPTVLGFIEQRAADLGGRQNLSAMEKMILGKLSPKGGTQPTYALLDDVRRDLTAARVKRQGPFKDSDTGLIKKLERELMTDQRAAIEPHGLLDLFDTARRTVAVRKGLEDDLIALFGKAVDGSLVDGLSGAVAALPKGNAAPLVRLLNAIPEGSRQEVVASGLNAAFGKSARNGQLSFPAFANWYEGLLRNKQSYAALMSNLPQPARKQLSDLYRVSRGIRLATRERITTGRIQAVQEEIRGADTLLSNLYGVAKRAAVGIPAEAATSAVGLPGAGIAAGITSALTKGKPNTMKSVDSLLSSPEFIDLAKKAGKPGEQAAARRFANSRRFMRFVRAAGSPRELSNRERWVLQSLQAQNQQQ